MRSIATVALCVSALPLAAAAQGKGVVVSRQDRSTKRGSLMETPVLANRRLQPLGHLSTIAAP